MTARKEVVRMEGKPLKFLLRFKAFANSKKFASGLVETLAEKLRLAYSSPELEDLGCAGEPTVLAALPEKFLRLVPESFFGVPVAQSDCGTSEGISEICFSARLCLRNGADFEAFYDLLEFNDTKIGGTNRSNGYMIASAALADGSASYNFNPDVLTGRYNDEPKKTFCRKFIRREDWARIQRDLLGTLRSVGTRWIWYIQTPAEAVWGAASER